MIKACYRPLHFIHKCGDISLAHQVFAKMPSRDVVSWNSSLMAGYSSVSLSDCVVDAFVEAGSRKTLIDKFSYSCALSGCAENGELRKGKVVHGLVVVCGLARRTFLTNSLMDMYAKCGRIDDVRLVFDHSDDLDDVSWNTLLSAYVRIGWPEVALNILVWMHRSGVKLNSFALGSILKACSGLGDSWELRRMLHGCVIKVGLDLNYFVGSAMLDMYAKNGGLDEAIKVFERIPNPSVVVFNAMIAGFSRLGTEVCPEVRLDALRLYSEMLRRRLIPSKFTFKSVLEACKLGKAFDCGKQIHAQVITSGLQEDDFIASVLVELYSNSGFIQEGLQCFRSALKQELVTWTCMISAYVENEHFERALRLFTELLELGMKPDQFTLSSVLNACAKLGVLRSGEQIQCHAAKAGLDHFTIFGNSQVDMYTKSGDLHSAIKTFQDTGSINIISWSAMILSHALLGRAKDALMLFEKMIEVKVVPNDVTFLAVLTACCRGGLMEEGIRYFDSMRVEYGITPNMNHCACIVDLLGQAERLADAEDFILSYGFDSDPVIWRALLYACQHRKDVKRGIQVAKRLMELEPFTPTPYMLLYNMFLDAGDISSAMRTRGLMRERGLSREISLSWIEISGSVRVFEAGDNSDPQSSEIYTQLEAMLLKLKQMGRNNVTVLDLEAGSKGWKEMLMRSHGEILAVALGTIHLPVSVPIRVMRNSRPCADCHALLKLLSESERREVIVRDPIRFHSFTWGSCSCGDYW